MGFTRRFGYYPGVDVITQIEGVSIIDLPPPPTPTGVGSGTVEVIGEFADVTYGVSVDGTGTVNTNPQPVEIFSAQDLINKVGGFDPTLGDWGASGGNGYAAVRGKSFSRLIICPVNIASAQGMRFFRVLPLSTSQTSTVPIVPVQGGLLPAGTQFYTGSANVKVAKTVVFTALPIIATGTGGSTVVGASAATQVFDATSGFDWTTIVRPDGSIGTYKGDILVIGNNNAGSVQPTAEAGTYRVAATPSSGNAVTLEKLDGSSFAFTAQTNVPWRLHYGSDADSAPNIVVGTAGPGGYASADAGGYNIPVHPITNSTGGNTDGTWAAGTIVQPQVTPPALTGSSWAPLSGLEGRVMPGGSGGLSFTAAVQAPNPVASPTIDALYAPCFTASISQQPPVNAVNVIFPARISQAIETALVQNIDNASAVGFGRMGIFNPAINQVSLTTVLGTTYPGAGAKRDERLIYTWPGVQTYIPEAVGFNIQTADGNFTKGGILDLPATGWLASVLSLLPPERNPGQAQPPVPAIMQTILGYQRACPVLGMNEYIALKAAGVCAMRMDTDVGPIFQSGITTSLISGTTNISRRRMADYIQDSITQILQPFSKLPLTNQYKDSAITNVDAFLNNLLSLNNPSQQRITAFQIDDKSGNTPQSLAAGIYVIIVRVQLTPTANYIVLQSEIGEGVVITTPQSV
jgi:hypothetical protein